MQIKPSPPKVTKKRIYEKPLIREYGSIKDHTKAVTAPTGMDGGVAPSNKVMTCVSLPHFIQEHNWLIHDHHTQQKFREAIFSKVKPGDVVLDLGTGTGLHAVFAAQAGAKTVYAVDSGSIINFSKLVAQKNNLSEKIIFLQTDAQRLELPEKVDVIITNIGLFNMLVHLPQVIQKHLKPQGKLIPESAEIEFSLVEDASFYQQNICTWDEQKYNADFSILKQSALSQVFYNNWQPECLLTTSKKLGATDFSHKTEYSTSISANLTCLREGTAHGILGWTTFYLDKDISFSTKPPMPVSPQVWNQWFLPLATPQRVKKGDCISAEVKMNAPSDSQEPKWSWTIGQFQ